MAAELARRLAGQGIDCSSAAAVLAQHAHDESWHRGTLPSLVCFPTEAAQAAAAVAACRDVGLAVVPFGTGTGMEGQVVPPEGAVAISTRRMDRILHIDAVAGRAKVQAGVTRKQLNQALRDSGWQFTVDPGADASLGGMASTRASGTNSVRYGTMRENILSLRVVMPDGRLIDTGHPDCAGLSALFVGAEGALGLIVELDVRLYPVPEEVAAASSAFADLQAAVAAAMAIVSRGIRVARVELLDAHAIAAVNAWNGTAYPVAPTLLFEFHGSAAELDRDAGTVGSIVAAHGGTAFAWARRAEDRNRMWQVRHDAFYAAMGQRPGAKGFTTDVCVPISRLAEAVDEAARMLADCAIPHVIGGHVGDGNFHVLFAVEPGNAAEIAFCERYNEALVHAALAMGGTCTGEHGVGLGKARYLAEEHGPALDVMAALRAGLDPAACFNPGKGVPHPRSRAEHGG